MSQEEVIRHESKRALWGNHADSDRAESLNHEGLILTEIFQIRKKPSYLSFTMIMVSD